MQEITDALHAMKFGGITIYPLALLAVVALVIMIEKAYLHWRRLRLPPSLTGLIETYGFTWEKLEQELHTVNEKLSRPEDFMEEIKSGGLPKEHGRLQSAIDRNYDSWEEIHLQLEEE